MQFKVIIMSYDVFLIASRLLGSLALLIFGMKVMSNPGKGLRFDFTLKK